MSALDDFTGCMKNSGQEVLDAVTHIVEKAGEVAIEVFKKVYSWWNALDPTTRRFIIASAAANATYLISAMAAAGIAGEDILEVVAGAITVATVALFMDALLTCSGILP